MLNSNASSFLFYLNQNDPILDQSCPRNLCLFLSHLALFFLL